MLDWKAIAVENRKELVWGLGLGLACEDIAVGVPAKASKHASSSISSIT